MIDLFSILVALVSFGACFHFWVQRERFKRINAQLEETVEELYEQNTNLKQTLLETAESNKVLKEAHKAWASHRDWVS